MPSAVIVLIGRILLAVLFILAGFGKFTDIAGTAGYFGSLNIPAPTAVAWLSAIFETVAGLCILAGFQTRIAACLLAAFSIVAGYLGHYGQGGEDAMMAMMHMQAFMKDLALGGGFLVLAMHGPGAPVGRRAARLTRLRQSWRSPAPVRRPSGRA